MADDRTMAAIKAAPQMGPAPRTPGYVNPDIRRTFGDLLAMLSGGGPLADPQFRADVKARALDVPHGIARGISADLLGAPVDAMASLMSLPRMAGVPGAPDFRSAPFGGSQQIGELMQRLGVLRAPTGSGAEAVGRVVGGAMASPSVVGPVMATAEDALKYGALGLSQPSPLTVWHGTPHRFAPEPGKPLGSFRSDKIGSGEGAQAYGYGHYVAENQRVGAGYKERLAGGNQYELNGVPYYSLPDVTVSPERKLVEKFATVADSGGTPLQAVAKIKADALQELQQARKNLADVTGNLGKTFDVGAGWGDLRQFTYTPDMAKKAEQLVKYAERQYEMAQGFNPDAVTKNAGSLYKADLADAAIPKMLDWDKPLGQQHPDVRAALEKIAPKNRSGQSMIGLDATGGEVVRALGMGDGASEMLRQAGIPGIQYLDGSSRAAGQGTRNFVVFPGNEDLLKILERQ